MPLTESNQEFLECLDLGLTYAEGALEACQLALLTDPNNPVLQSYFLDLQRYEDATRKMLIAFMENQFPPSFHIAAETIRRAKLHS
jgi:hypothetical protein